MILIQFTIPASGVIQFLDPGDPNSGLYYQQITIQNNNASGNIRVGDASVSSTRGILLYPGGGSVTFTGSLSHRRSQDIWAYGTSGAIIDVLLLQ